MLILYRINQESYHVISEYKLIIQSPLVPKPVAVCFGAVVAPKSTN